MQAVEEGRKCKRRPCRGLTKPEKSKRKWFKTVSSPLKGFMSKMAHYINTNQLLLLSTIIKYLNRLFSRLVLREFKGKNRGRFGSTSLVRSSKWRPRHSSEADFNEIYDKPAYKTKKSCYRHPIYTTKRTHLRQITK